MNIYPTLQRKANQGKLWNEYLDKALAIQYLYCYIISFTTHLILFPPHLFSNPLMELIWIWTPMYFSANKMALNVGMAMGQGKWNLHCPIPTLTCVGFYGCHAKLAPWLSRAESGLLVVNLIFSEDYGKNKHIMEDLNLMIYKKMGQVRHNQNPNILQI